MATVAHNSQLYVKSYFAASIEEAMEQARAELGPDALLLNTRDAPPEGRHLGECEAVFGTRPAPALVKCIPEAPVDPVAELRERVEELRQIVTRAVPSAQREWGRAELAGSLCSAGLARALADEIENAVQQRLRRREVVEIGRPGCAAGWGAEVVIRETVQELEGRFEVAPEIGRIVVLVGPAGAGKTSALVKLAVTRGLMARHPVHLLSIDHYRIAAADQLRTYAAILGVPFTLAETTLALAQAIDSAPPETLLLIDTPGYAPASMADNGRDLASFLQSRQDIDTHLVLTASMRQADLDRSVDLFRAFRPAKLLFTRLDETDSTAAMFCEATRTGLPLSFFSTGQLIPEDLEAATKNRITASLVLGLPEAFDAVA
jgi:flagellar biosynthesis protein FlhF